MKLTTEDIDRALQILHRWESAARARDDETAQQHVALLIKVIAGLTGRTK